MIKSASTFSKITIVAQYYWPEPIGSAPYCTDMAEWLAEHGYGVEVITSRPHYPSQNHYAKWLSGERDHEVHNKVTISRCAGGPRSGSGFFSRVKNDIRFMFYLMARSRDAQYRDSDVVLCFVPSVLTLYPARLIARYSKAPLIVVIHDIESGLADSLGIARLKPIVWLMRLVERVAFSMCTKIIVLSKAMKNEIVSLGIDKPIGIIPIWTDIPNDQTTPKSTCFTVMYSGNFGKKQNLDQLVPLFSEMSNEHKDVRFIMQGEGSERCRFESTVHKLKLNNVSFNDLVPASELFKSLRNADVHLVPQANNVAPYAIPSKVYSIMASKRPFIAIAETDSPLSVLAKESGGGIVVKPGDNVTLKSFLVRLASDNKLVQEMRQNGRKYVETNMLRENILTKYENILCKCVSEVKVNNLTRNTKFQ